MLVKKASGVNYERMLQDPAASFQTPEELMDYPDLTPEQKVELLDRWRIEAGAIATPADALQADGAKNDSLTQRIADAMNRLQPAADAASGDAPTVLGADAVNAADPMVIDAEAITESIDGPRDAIESTDVASMTNRATEQSAPYPPRSSD